MRIVYDISVLSAGLYDQRARTGVARYVENLRLALLTDESIDLSYCAFHSLKEYLQLNTNIDFFVGVEGRSLGVCGNPLASTTLDFIGKLYPKASEGQNNWRRRRILDRILHLANHFCDNGTLVETSGRDIFHSTFYPFPKTIERHKLLKRFITVHDLIPMRYPQFFGKRQCNLSRRILECIELDDWVITNSEATKNDLCDYMQFDPARVFVTPLAASDLFYQCSNDKILASVKDRYQIPDGPYVLSVCTLEPRKNIDQVIHSFINLLQQQHIDDLNLVLVGAKGWNFEKIFHEIASVPSMKNRCVVTGYVFDEDLAALYSGAMAFVYPSFYEGFGLPPLEAMQCGVPVIVSHTSSLPEVVGNAGIMIDPNDSAGFSQAILDFYSQPALRKEFSGKSMERASFFSWENCSKLTVSAYETALFG